MRLTFVEKAVTGLLTIVPANERKFVDEMADFNFSPARSMKLKEVMGYDRHRIVAGPVSSSDLAIAALRHVFAHGFLAPEEIDALVVVTQSPDYFMPGTAMVIHGRLGLNDDILCLDLNQGCAGFVVGLINAFMLLDQPAINKVVVVNVDVLSRKVSNRDRNSYPLIGDAASLVVVERRPGAGQIDVSIKMDGAGREALIIPAGGFRQPSDAGTAVMAEDSDGNLRSLDHLRMDGSAVFNFVMTQVPPLIQDLLEAAGVAADQVDAFLCHQPNRFMLQKLADKLGVPYDKMPSNVVEKFGNSSGVTIPLATTLNFGDRLLHDSMKVCLAGFGAGLTWSAMLMELGPLSFCSMIEFEED